MNYIILGGSILSCALAEKLSESSQVYIVDSRMELGMPTTDIGLLNNKKSISHFMDESKFEYANFQSNGIRAEWVAKFYSHYLTKIGVKILTRSRILKNEDSVEIKSLGSSVKLNLSTCKLFDLREVSGNVRMNTEKTDLGDELFNPLDTSNYIIREGGIISSDENFNDLEFDLIRADGTREIWWKDFEQPPKPNLGFLERMTNFGPDEKAKNSIDSIIELAIEISQSIQSNNG